MNTRLKFRSWREGVDFLRSLGWVSDRVAQELGAVVYVKPGQPYLGELAIVYDKPGRHYKIKVW